jgi:ABC-2 type transport system ATP-binding protein
VVTHGLVKSFADEPALRGVDLQLPEEAVMVLVGPNGAGKSTLVKILLDLVRADAGSAEVFGLDPRAEGPRVRARVGYVPEQHDWGYGWMPVGRLLRHHSTFFPGWDAAYADVLARRFELRLERRFGDLSKGQARRVQLVLALAHRPALLVLDEPTDGLDPQMRDDTLGLLAEHLSEFSTTVLISTHQVHEVDRLADHLAVMRGGRLVTQLDRHSLHLRLRRYRASVPDGWSGARELDDGVLRRSTHGREIEWLIWGEPDEVTARLTLAGAVVHDVAPLTIEDAALALLNHAGEA